MRILTPLMAVSVFALITGGVALGSDTSSRPSSSESSSGQEQSSTTGEKSSDTQAGQIGYGNNELKGEEKVPSSEQAGQAVQPGQAEQPGQYGQPGSAETTLGTTTATTSEVSRGYLKNEGIAVKPQLGVIAYRDNTLTDTARAAGGIGLDWNVAKAFSMSPSVYMGPSSGFIYSHLGSATSNFFGSGADFVENQAGANLLVIPANLKVGYNINDFYRVSVHGGGNVVYRSIASSMQLGSDFAQDGSLWKMYPNAGFDLEAGLGPNLSLAIRPDVTFTTTDNFFTGMVALGINLA